MRKNSFKRIIADTSIWVEFLKNNPKFFPLMRTLLEKSQIIAIECIFGELLQGVKSDKEKSIILAYWNCLPKIYETGLCLDAGTYSNENQLMDKGVGLIDSFIISSAMKNDLLVWTLDKKIISILDVQYQYQ